MNEWKHSNLINKTILESLTPQQLKDLAEMLEKVK